MRGLCVSISGLLMPRRAMLVLPVWGHTASHEENFAQHINIHLLYLSPISLNSRNADGFVLTPHVQALKCACCR